jgi:hypothetical protein
MILVNGLAGLEDTRVRDVTRYGAGGPPDFIPRSLLLYWGHIDYLVAECHRTLTSDYSRQSVGEKPVCIRL